jgi:hypothetical protein
VSLFVVVPPLSAFQAGSWTAEAPVWIALAALVALVAAAAGVWTLVVHLREVREEGKRLETLADLDQKLGRLVADREDLDLRRLEHVLIDLRDGQKRLEDVLLRVLERERPGGEAALGQDLVVPPSGEVVGERVVNRLLAMGYRHVQVVTRAEKLAELGRKDGEVLVEARRDGVLYKGRVVLRGGRLADVDMNPAYSIFP